MAETQVYRYNLEMPDGKTYPVESEVPLDEAGVKRIAEQLGFKPEKEEKGGSAVDRIMEFLEDPETKAAGVRIAGTLAGALAGAAAGAARGKVGIAKGAVEGAVKGYRARIPQLVGSVAGAALAEPIAQAITPRKESAGETLANIATTVIQPSMKAAPLLSRVTREAITGMGQAIAHENIRSLADEGSFATREANLKSAAFGAAIGAPFGLFGKAPVPEAKTQLQKTAQAVNQASAKTPAAVASVEANKTALGTETVPSGPSVTKEAPTPTQIPTEASKPLKTQGKAVSEASGKGAKPEMEIIPLGKKYLVAEGVGEPVEQFQLKKRGDPSDRGVTVTKAELEKAGFEVPKTPEGPKGKIVSIDDDDAIEAAAAAQAKKEVAEVSPEPVVEAPAPPPTPPPAAPKAPATPAPEAPAKGIRARLKRVLDDPNANEEYKALVAEDPNLTYDKWSNSKVHKMVEEASDTELDALTKDPDSRISGPALLEKSQRLMEAGDLKGAVQAESAVAASRTLPAQEIAAISGKRTTAADLREVEDTVTKMGRVLTDDQKKELAKLSIARIKAERVKNAAETAVHQAPTPETIAASAKATEAYAQAQKAYDALANQLRPESYGDILSKVIQGNLLTPLSVTANVVGNALFYPIRKASASLATGLDLVYSTAGNQKRSIMQASPLPSIKELAAFADGVRTAAKELITGPSVDSYIKAEVQRGFTPIRKLVSAFSGKNLPVLPSGKVAFSDRLKAGIEGTLGIPPEIMFRLLALGDKPFRRAAHMEALLEQARLRGIKAKDLDKFIAAPGPQVTKAVEDATRKAIFAQENKGVQLINRVLDTGIAQLLQVDQVPALRDTVKVLGRMVVPFRQFPVNYLMTAMNFAAPELAMAKAVYYGSKGNGRKAMQNAAEGLMGMMMYAAVDELWRRGLITEPASKDNRTRSAQYAAMGPARLNLDGIKRYVKGEDYTWRPTDRTADWTKIGIPAAIMHLRTNQYAQEREDAAKLGRAPRDLGAIDIKNNPEYLIRSFPGMANFALDQSFLAGTSAIVEAFGDSDPDNPKLKNWFVNMFKVISAVPVPNTVEAVARAQMEYIPELRGKDFIDTVKNTWDFKTEPVRAAMKALWDHQIESLPEKDRFELKYDTFGEPLRRTPKDSNPYVSQSLDVFKLQRKEDDRLIERLGNLYLATGDTGVMPNPVGRIVEYRGNRKELSPQDYSALQQIVGRTRRAYADHFVNSAAWNSLGDDATGRQEKIFVLKRIWNDAGETAMRHFLSENIERLFPEAFGRPHDDTQATLKGYDTQAHIRGLATGAVER